MFGVKGVASAVKELVELGGRVSDDTLEWLNKLLGDELDDVQENAKEFLDKVDKAVDAKVADLTSKLEDALERLETLESKPTTGNKAPAPRKETHK